MTVSAIIPAFNEENRVAATIRACAATGLIDQVIVVDDGSTDRTAHVSTAAGADVVVRLAKNRGKGEALKQGARAAGGDVLCFVDADLGESAFEFVKLIRPVLEGKADMTVARWTGKKKKAGFGLVMGLARLGIKMLTGYRAVSPLSGQRVLRRAVWESPGSLDRGFGVEVALTVKCLRNGYRLLEIPVTMEHRETGRDLAGFVHRGRQFVQVARSLYSAWRQKAGL